MLRKVTITGPAEEQSRQKHPVYNDPQAYPSSLTWQVDVEPLRVPKEEFFENLFFSTERNGGNAFFLPEEDRKLTICRYEWHLPWRNRAAQIRLGIVFKVDAVDDPSSGTAYLGTNDGYRERGAENHPSQISARKLKSFQHFISEEVRLANKPRSERPQQNWKFVLYAKGASGFWEKPFLALSGSVLVLSPVYQNGVIKTAVVIEAAGITRSHAHRKSMMIFHRILALLTLATGNLWEASNDPDMPKYFEGKLSVRTDLSKRLFLDGEAVPRLGPPVSCRSLSVVRYGLSILEGQQDFSQTYLSSLFAYYGGMIARAKSPSLSNVGFIAALGLLATPYQRKCTGDVYCSCCGALSFRHNLVGDRAAITETISAAMNDAFGGDFLRGGKLERWVKEAYNKHRSNYVHSAFHQFSEFSQVFSSEGPTTIHVPTAIPSDGKLTREENEHSTVTSAIPRVTRIVLLRFLLRRARVGRAMHRLRISPPDFSVSVHQEAFVGMPTSGWVRMT